MKNKRLSAYINKLTLTLIAFAGIFMTPVSAQTVPNIPSQLVIAHTETGHGKPLVLIHAFPTDQRLWTPQIADLKKHFRVITLDLYGFGESAASEGQAITMEQYADEVNHLLNKLHIEKAIIGGESMGGYVSLAFLKKYPDKVEGLILSDTQSIADTDEGKAKRETTAVDVLENGTAQYIKNFLPKSLSANASEETKNYLQDIMADQEATGLASASRGMGLREDTSNILAATKLPILILTGDADIVISPQQSQNMHALAKNSKLVTITQAGHLSNLEQPQQWNQAVIDMFASR